MVRSDTDCEGASEPEASAGKTQTPGKKNPPSPDVIIEDQYSDQEEMAKRAENISLNAKGTGLLFPPGSLMFWTEKDPMLYPFRVVIIYDYDFQGEKV